MTAANVDDIVASVEDAVRRAYALGRADAMRRVVELAQSDDPGLRAVALLGPAEPAKPTPPQALLDAPQPAPAQHGPDHDQTRHGPGQPSPAHTQAQHHAVAAHEHAADQADAEHEARQKAAASGEAPGQPAAAPAAPQPEREVPATVGGRLADFFYPIGSKRR